MNLVQTLPPGCWLVIRTTISPTLTNEWIPVPHLIKRMDLISRLMVYAQLCEKFQNTLDYNHNIIIFFGWLIFRWDSRKYCTIVQLFKQIWNQFCISSDPSQQMSLLKQLIWFFYCTVDAMPSSRTTFRCSFARPHYYCEYSLWSKLILKCYDRSMKMIISLCFLSIFERNTITFCRGTAQDNFPIETTPLFCSSAYLLMAYLVSP